MLLPSKSENTLVVSEKEKQRFGSFLTSVPKEFKFHQSQTIYISEPRSAKKAPMALKQAPLRFRPNVVLNNDGLPVVTPELTQFLSLEAKPSYTIAERLAIFVDIQIMRLKGADAGLQYRLMDRKVYEKPHPAQFLRQSMKNPEGMQIEQLQLAIALPDETICMVTASHLPGESFKEVEPLFLSVMQNMTDRDGNRISPPLGKEAR